MSDEHGVHTDPAAIADLVAVAETEHARIAADGSVAGYRAGRTLRLGVELRRQLRRRRTQLALGFLAVLPFVRPDVVKLDLSAPAEDGWAVMESAHGYQVATRTDVASAPGILGWDHD